MITLKDKLERRRTELYSLLNTISNPEVYRTAEIELRRRIRVENARKKIRKLEEILNKSPLLDTNWEEFREIMDLLQ